MVEHQKDKHMSNHTMGYIALKAEQERKEKKKHQDSIDAENELFIRRTTTKQTKIPDMREAYSKVLNADYEYSEAEAHYRRFTSGSYVDGMKKNKG